MIRDGKTLTKGLVVAKVSAGSIASEMEIEPGDIILGVNDKQIIDVLDLQYYTADEDFTLVVEKKNQEIWELKIEKEPGELLGIEVNSLSTEGLKHCSNNCVFCFVRQMPPGLRESLYDRDDDYRLSVTQGSYITLSNLSPADFRRIIAFHISPLYISVHAWDPAARVRLMGNRKVGKIAEQIKMLAEAGLTLHTQIVLVPGYNDGVILQETVEKLASFYPSVQSIGVVPVGLTKFRKGLPDLKTVDAELAGKILAEGQRWQKNYKDKYGKNLVYFSDEFYVITGQAFPPVQEYDDFPQIENGIGMAALMQEEIQEFLPYLPQKIPRRSVHIITGVSAGAFFTFWAERLAGIQGLSISVHEIINNFFGSTVTVAGLLTAQDIAGQLGNLQGDYFLIPRVMLKADEEVFLDDYDIPWLERKVNGKALIVENNGRAFLEGVLGMELEVQEYE